MKFVILTLALLAVQNSSATDIQAKNCQIFVKKLVAHPYPHGGENIEAIVKVGWLGNDEHIQQVGFYGFTYTEDLGNSPQCHSGSGSSSSVMKVIDPAPASDAYSKLEYGEYSFSFGVATGSVESTCRGFNYSQTGSFFVRTDKNTYYLNPNFDSQQHFIIDRAAYDRLTSSSGGYIGASTLRPDLQYYNPGACQ